MTLYPVIRAGFVNLERNLEIAIPAPNRRGSHSSTPSAPRLPGGEPRLHPCGRTGCAGFDHPSHPSSLQKHTFAHLWPG